MTTTQTAAQMLHERYVRALRQLLADGTKRSRKARADLEAKLAEALAYEVAHPEIR
jgi:hypothetical protein